MTLSNLNEAELKDFCKFIKLEEFKKYASNSKAISTLVIRELGKSPNRIQKSNIDQYIFEHSDEDNGLIDFMIDMLENKFSKELPNYRYFANYVRDKSYSEIDQNEESVSAVREAYKSVDYKMQFESFIRLHCKNEGQEDFTKTIEKLSKENIRLSDDLRVNVMFHWFCPARKRCSEIQKFSFPYK